MTTFLAQNQFLSAASLQPEAEPIYECENCIGMIEYGCYCQAMDAVAPGGPCAKPIPQPMGSPVGETSIASARVTMSPEKRAPAIPAAESFACGRAREPISNFVAPSPLGSLSEAAVTNSNPDGGYMGLRLSPALGTSVNSEAAVSHRTASDIIQSSGGGGESRPATEEGVSYPEAQANARSFHGSYRTPGEEAPAGPRVGSRIETAGVATGPQETEAAIRRVAASDISDDDLYWQLRFADDPFTRDLAEIPDPHAFFNKIIEIDVWADDAPMFLSSIA